MNRADARRGDERHDRGRVHLEEVRAERDQRPQVP
jgi:hypothetical protein